MWVHDDPILIRLVIDGEVIWTTPEHPFYLGNGQWISAGNLQDGDLIRNANWQLGVVQDVTTIYQTRPMYNLSVDTAHTYFVGVQKFLVHNICADLITRQWKAISITDARCQSGCFAVAEKIQGFIGGEISQIKSALPSGRNRPALLPSIDGHFPQWQDHWVVVKDGRVYDAFTGHQGQTFEEYMARWDYADEIIWPWE